MSLKAARNEAKTKGELSYWTGTPCKQGHLALRKTLIGECRECAANAKRKKYAENPELAIARVIDYQNRNRESVIEAGRRYNAENRESRNDYAKKHWLKNLEANRVAARELYKCRAPYFEARYAENKESILKANAEYRRANPDMSNAYTAKRRAAKLSATPPWSDIKAIREVYALREVAQELFGIPLAVDHVIPLRGKGVCGLHVSWNLRVISATENSVKNNRYCQRDALAFRGDVDRP